MKTLYLFTYLFFLQIGLLFGQSQISGIITDEKGLPLPGVNIFIKGSFDGTSSGKEGKYVFETSLEGEQTLVFQFLGFKAQELSINCNQQSIQVESIRLIEAITEMNAVTISAGAMDASDESKAVILKPIDIVTTPSAMGDVVGAFQTLPGTSTVGNDGRLFVRGGDASEVGIYVDGMRVGNAYGTTAANVPTRTRFNANLFKGTFFSTGGYSAEYGQALSSALALKTKDLAIRNQGDLSIMSVGGGYSHTLANEKHSITLSANYFDLQPYQNLIKQNFDWERSPHSWDLELAAQQKIKKNGLVKVLARTESGGMSLWRPEPGKGERGVLTDINNTYSYVQTNYRQALKNNWTLFSGIAFSHNKDEIGLDSLQVHRTSNLTHIKTTATKDFSDRLSANSGIEVYLHGYEELLPNKNLSRKIDETEAYLFTEWDWYLNKDFIVRGGLRGGRSQLSDQYWLDPRISLAYKVSESGTISFASGKFHQLPVDNYRVIDNSLQNSNSNHLILNYLYTNNGITFRSELFYKSYDRLVTFEGYPQEPQELSNGGYGNAKGFDLFYRDRKSIKNTDFWVTYSFVNSERKFDQFSNQVQPNFAPKHNFSIVAKHFITNLNSQFGASISLNDGYTYSNPNLPGEMNSKTESYQSLSLSWSYLPKPNLIIHLACSNVLGRENIFGYTYTQNPNEMGVFESLPSGQVAPRFLFLGIFLTLSKDKTANNLNNL